LRRFPVLQWQTGIDGQQGAGLRDWLAIRSVSSDTLSEVNLLKNTAHSWKQAGE